LKKENENECRSDGFREKASLERWISYTMIYAVFGARDGMNQFLHGRRMKFDTRTPAGKEFNEKSKESNPKSFCNTNTTSYLF